MAWDNSEILGDSGICYLLSQVCVCVCVCTCVCMRIYTLFTKICLMPLYEFHSYLEASPGFLVTGLHQRALLSMSEGYILKCYRKLSLYF